MDKCDIILTLVLFYFVFLGFKLSKRYEDSSILNADQKCNDEYSSPCQWSEWTEWTQCSVSCGQGRRVRRHHCVHMRLFSQPPACSYTTIQETACTMPACPNDKAGKDQHTFDEGDDGEEEEELQSDDDTHWKEGNEWTEGEQGSGRSGTESEGPIPTAEDLNQDTDGGLDSQEEQVEEEYREDAEDEWGDEEAESGDEKEGYYTVEEEEEEQDDREELIRKKKKKKKRIKKKQKEEQESVT